MIKEYEELNQLVIELFITSLEANTMDKRAEHIITKLFEAYWGAPALLPNYILKKYFKEQADFSRIKINKLKQEMQDDSSFARLVSDHISGMTDTYAFTEYKKLYLPE